MMRAGVALAACLAIFSAACSAPDKAKPTITSSGELGLSVSFLPDPPAPGIETLTIGVHDLANKPVEGADVEVSTTTGGMSMNAMSVVARSQGNGLYTAAVELGATTRWLFDVSAKAGGRAGLAHVAVDVR